MRATYLLLAGIVLVALVACEPSPPPGAVHWGPKVSYYDGTLRVSGEGDFYNAQASWATNAATVNDRADDGNSVYSKTNFSFLEYDSSCSCNRYKNASSHSTPEISNRSQTDTVRTPLHGNSSTARAEVYVCAQMGWPVPDSCSSAALPSFNY